MLKSSLGCSLVGLETFQFLFKNMLLETGNIGLASILKTLYFLAQK